MKRIPVEEGGKFQRDPQLYVAGSDGREVLSDGSAITLFSSYNQRRYRCMEFLEPKIGSI